VDLSAFGYRNGKTYKRWAGSKPRTGSLGKVKAANVIGKLKIAEWESQDQKTVPDILDENVNRRQILTSLMKT